MSYRMRFRRRVLLTYNCLAVYYDETKCENEEFFFVRSEFDTECFEFAQKLTDSQLIHFLTLVLYKLLTYLLDLPD